MGKEGGVRIRPKKMSQMLVWHPILQQQVGKYEISRKNHPFLLQVLPNFALSPKNSQNGHFGQLWGVLAPTVFQSPELTGQSMVKIGQFSQKNLSHKRLERVRRGTKIRKNATFGPEMYLLAIHETWWAQVAVVNCNMDRQQWDTSGLITWTYI